MFKSKGFKLPKLLLYTIVITKGSGCYVPEVGDLIALTDVRPRSVDDLQRPNKSYIIALVQSMITQKFVYRLFVLSSKPITGGGFKGDFKKDLRSYRRRDIKHFVVYLTNMKTNIRISQAIHSQPEGCKKMMIEKLLRVDSSVRLTVVVFKQFLGFWSMTSCTNYYL